MDQMMRTLLVAPPAATSPYCPLVDFSDQGIPIFDAAFAEDVIVDLSAFAEADYRRGPLRGRAAQLAIPGWPGRGRGHRRGRVPEEGARPAVADSPGGVRAPTASAASSRP